MATDMNTWEEQALPHTTTGHLPNPQTFDSLIYPGLYSPSGLDILAILTAIHTRPNPTIPLGAVDASCALLVSDLARPDQPVIYASAGFTRLTGYSAPEVVGRNCRFLQFPPPPPTTTTTTVAAAAAPSLGFGVGVGVGLDCFVGAVPGRGVGLGQVPGREKGMGMVDDGEAGEAGGGGEDWRGYGVDVEAVRAMRRAVRGNREVQVEVVNYKKSGERFVNLVTIIPVQVPTAGGHRGERVYNYSVGFMCDLASLGA